MSTRFFTLNVGTKHRMEHSVEIVSKFDELPQEQLVLYNARAAASLSAADNRMLQQPVGPVPVPNQSVEPVSEAIVPAVAAPPLPVPDVQLPLVCAHPIVFGVRQELDPELRLAHPLAENQLEGYLRENHGIKDLANALRNGHTDIGRSSEGWAAEDYPRRNADHPSTHAFRGTYMERVRAAVIDMVEATSKLNKLHSIEYVIIFEVVVEGMVVASYFAHMCSGLDSISKDDKRVNAISCVATSDFEPGNYEGLELIYDRFEKLQTPRLHFDLEGEAFEFGMLKHMQEDT